MFLYNLSNYGFRYIKKLQVENFFDLEILEFLIQKLRKRQLQVFF